MNTTLRKLWQDAKRESGISLIMAIFVGLVLSSVGYVTIHSVIMDSNVAGMHAKTVQAFWLAEAGMERAMRYLRFANPPPGGTAPFTHFDNVALGAGTFTVEIDPDDGNPSTFMKEYVITSTGTVGDVERSIRASVKTVTFGNYAYLTGNEGGTIWFNTNDLLEGPIHTNDKFSITGRPVFKGKVTSVATSFNKGSSYNPDFQDGYQLGVPPVIFPTLQNLIDNYFIENGSSTPALTIDARFNKDASIRFNSDGTLTYSVWKYRWNGSRRYIIHDQVVDINSLNGLLWVKGDVEIEGTFKGQLTVVATDNIYITDDIRYSDSSASGKPPEGSTNTLGLISKENIVVADTWANSSDVVINGALLALGDSFYVENYAYGYPRGTLTIWGSLSQKVRGPVGTFGYGWTTGFQKDYHYDSRLGETPPPYYPSTGQYEVFSWQEIDGE
ncbi:MAG TPA: DUF4900 domain-containing protein [Bacteroidetes bacterium]|nr:DUF4900 domain-containing protein [Bacteroidota bacterium]